MLPVRLEVRVEEQLVFLDRTAQRAAKLILVEERLIDSILVVEPLIRGEVVVPVIPVSLAVQFVRARRRRAIRGKAPALRRAAGSDAGREPAMSRLREEHHIWMSRLREEHHIWMSRVREEHHIWMSRVRGEHHA